MAAISAASRSASDAKTPLAPGTRGLAYQYIATAVILGLLYVLPAQTAVYWMWDMGDPRSAMLFGSLYLAGIVSYLVGLRDNDWIQIQSAFQLSFAALAYLLIPVAVHWATVRPYHPMTLIWLASYYSGLFNIPIGWRAQEQVLRPPKLAGVQLSPFWRGWLIVRGIIYLALLVAGFVFADSVAQLWPWDIGVLNLRMFLGFLLPSILAAFIIIQGNYLWRRQRLGWIGIATGGVLELAALAIAPSPYNWSAPLALILPLIFVEWLVTAVLLLRQYERKSLPGGG